MKKLFVWFNEVGKDDVGLVGGKGANLGEMTRAGIPVPPGFIVTSEAWYQFIEAAIWTRCPRYKTVTKNLRRDKVVNKLFCNAKINC
jgi:phosphoenolpyruvate synthase/pyruvate phosphate dikinase